MSLVRNAADQEQVRKAGRRVKQGQRQADADLRWLMSEPQGRRFMFGLLHAAGIFSLSFTGDNNRTNFNEGQRNVGLKYMAAIDRACPELYGVMVQENTPEIKTEEESDERGSDRHNDDND